MMENDLVVEYNKTNKKIDSLIEQIKEKSDLFSEKEVKKIMIEFNKMLLDQISILFDEVDELKSANKKILTENILLRKKDCHVNSR